MFSKKIFKICKKIQYNRKYLKKNKKNQVN